jgi:PAS domain S-box-containing protein
MKQHRSIRNKIMIPFMVIIAIIAIASIMISVFILSDLMYSYTDQSLKQDQRILHKNLKTLKYNLQNILSLLPHMKKIAPYDLKSIIQETETPSLLNWQKLRIFTTPSQVTTIEQQRYHSIFATPSPLTPHLYTQFEKLQFSFVGSTKSPSSRVKSPIVLEWTLSDETLTYFQELIQSEFALIYHTNKDQLEQSEILTISPIITKSIELQQAIKQLLENKKSTHSPNYTRHKIGDKTYLMAYKQTSWSPHLYSIVLTSTKALFITKLRITLSIISILLIISILVYAIYALIIQKLITSIDILSSVSKKVANGDLDQHVYLDSNDEVGELSESFNQMIANLKVYATNIKDEMHRSEAIISSIPESIIVTDLDNRLILANEKAESIFNFSGNKLKGKELLEHISNADLISALNAEKDDSPIIREIKITTPEGEDRIYSLTSSRVDSQNGKSLGIITVLRDLTHTRQIDALRDGFLRTVTHELRTPLTSVIGFIEITINQSDSKDKDTQKKYLTTALNEAKSLKTLIDDLLDLSQLKAGKRDITLTDISIKELIDSLMVTMAPLTKGRPLKLVSMITNKNIIIKGDKSKLRRIFLNIVSNAIKFTKEGTISIRCSETEHEVKISVTDTGIGIRESEKEIIFEKFRQIDYSSRREYDGIGLGLSIVKELVEIHNGHIEIDSHYGKGSTFTVCLPALKEQMIIPDTV